MIDQVESHWFLKGLEGNQKIEGVLAWKMLGDYIVIFFVLEHLEHLNDVGVVLGNNFHTISLNI